MSSKLRRHRPQHRNALVTYNRAPFEVRESTKLYARVKKMTVVSR